MKNLAKLLADTYLGQPITRYVIPKDGDVFNIDLDNLMYGRTKDTLKYLTATGVIDTEKVTQEMLLNVFDYDPITGIWTRIRTGEQVGYLTGIKSKQYLVVEIGGKQYKLHRLAFLYMEGYLPEHVDHEDQNSLHNWWSNLKDVTQQENSRNMKWRPNSSGILGVVKTAAGKYLARITVNGTCICLGTYSDKNEAAKVRADANILYGFHKNHGKQMNEQPIPNT